MADEDYRNSQIDLNKQFLQTGPQYIEGLRIALSQNDCYSVVRFAHTLKSTLRALRAEQLVRLAEALEKTGMAGDIKEAEFTFRRLETLIKELTEVEVDHKQSAA